MSYKDELLKKQEELRGNSLEFPLVKIQIDQKEGKFRIGGTKNENGEWSDAEFTDELKFVVFKKHGEYFYFNPDTEKVEKRSTIEENPANCVEIYSRTPISELKEAGYTFTYLSHLVGIKLNGEPIPADLVLKGSGVKSFIEFTEKEKDYWKNRLLYKLIVKLKKGKKGAVEYWYPTFKVQEVTEEEAKLILQNTDEVVEQFEEFAKQYNKRNNSEEAEEEEVPF